MILTTLCGVRVQADSQASEVHCPAVRFFDRSITLWLASQPKEVSPEVFEQDPGLLHARCPYSGRTLLSRSIKFRLLELGGDPTARDWQVSLLGEGAGP
jgi:hypothetical protein